MIIEFKLIMANVVLYDRSIDQVSIEWTESMPQARLLAITARWLHSTSFLTDRITGLERVGESKLELTPVETDSYAQKES